MKFNFTEAVKLAVKGFTPDAIVNLSKLDDSKFNKEDIIALVDKGYTEEKITELVSLFSETEMETETTGTEDKKDNPDETSARSTTDSQSKDDEDAGVDYKALYENEKKLRENLQHETATKDSNIKNGDNRSDFDIAVDFINDF